MIIKASLYIVIELAFISTIMPKNIFKVYWELGIFSVYIKGSVVSINLVISSNINK